MNPPSDRPTVPLDCTLHVTPCPGGCEIEDADGPDTRGPHPCEPMMREGTADRVDDPFEDLLDEGAATSG